MKKHWRPSYRLSEPGHHTIGLHAPRTPSHKAWAAKCWVAVLALAVAVLLLGQACLLLQNSATARSSVVFSLVRQKGGIIGSPGAVDVGHLALLDTLWSALPFTRAVHHKGHSSSIWGNTSTTSSPLPSDNLANQLQQGDKQAGAVQGSRSAAEPLDSSRPHFPALPQLRSPSHPEVGLLHHLAAAVLSSGLSAAEAREAYLAAFQAVPPPKGFPAWQVKLPPSPEAAAAAEAAEQQHQHKGAHYISLDEPDSDTISNVTAADFLKARPKGRTLADEAAVTAAAAAATAFLAQTAAAPGAVPHSMAHLQGTQAEQEGAQQQQQDQQQQQEASLQGRKAAEHLMKYALLLIKATHKVAPCATDDASLPIDKLMGGPHAPKVLLAVTGTAEGTEALPNLVLQLLQFVLQSRPGSLYISMVEGDAATSSSRSQKPSSTSTGDAAAYLDMLQLLLLPLRVPMMVVQADLPAHLEVQQHKHSLHAAARNTAIEPFFGNVGFPSTDLSSCSTDATEEGDDSAEAESGDDDAQEMDGPTASTVDIGSGMSLDQSLVEDGLSEASHINSMRAGLGDDAEAGASALAELSAPVPSVVYQQQRQARRSAGSWLLRARSRPSRSVLNRGSFAFDFISAGAHDDRTAPTAADSREEGQEPAAGSSREINKQAVAASDLNQPQISLQPHRRPECFNPDWVIFIEASSLFCKSDIQRLLMHTDADLTCGMDMHVAEPSSNAQTAGQAAAAASQQGTPAAEVVEGIRRQLLQEHQHHNLSQHSPQQRQQQEEVVGQQDSTPNPGSTELADWQLPQQQRKILQHQQHLQAEAARPMDAQQGAGSVPTATTAAAAAADVWTERPPALDIWKHPVVYAAASVGRMVNGLPFSAAPYYAAGHAPTLRRLVAGLPVQVHCCWSGLAKLSAEPFKRGLRFRAHPMHGECRAPSQNLMCDDLHRTGFNRVMIDAGVLLTRDLDVNVKFTPLIRAADRAPFVRRSRWVEVLGSGSAWELDSSSLRESYKTIQCCGEPQKQQQQLVVDEMVQAAAASSRVGEPLPLRGWDAQGCRAMDVLASNHTATFLQSIGVALEA